MDANSSKRYNSITKKCPPHPPPPSASISSVPFPMRPRFSRSFRGSGRGRWWLFPAMTVWKNSSVIWKNFRFTTTEPSPCHRACPRLMSYDGKMLFFTLTIRSPTFQTSARQPLVFWPETKTTLTLILDDGKSVIGILIPINEDHISRVPMFLCTISSLIVD